VGAAAVRAAVDGASDVMVTLVRQPGPDYCCDTGLTDLARVANVQRPFPAEFMAPDGRGVTPAFREYALPLLGAPLPEYPRLVHTPVVVPAP
jgi:6-phosphofructokinase 1